MEETTKLCSCGQPWPLAWRTDPTWGWVKDEPVPDPTVIPGHTGCLGRRKPTSPHRVISIHNFLRRRNPKTGVCRLCGKEVGATGRSGTHYAFLRHPEPHTTDPEDYIEVCPSCHKKMDAFDRKVRSLGIKIIRRKQ